jgi:hypothetical protein
MSSYTAENAASRERLRALLPRLTDAALALKVDHGWTIADELVHMAFWDQNRLALLNIWLSGGELPTATNAPDAVNEAVRVLGQMIPPREIIRLVMESAEAIDHAVEKLTAEQCAVLEQADMNRLLNRSLHRNGHLDEIEPLLK